MSNIGLLYKEFFWSREW